ncbi:tRNA pseudouridine synthase A [[Bacillus] enclensis]|uniref:tRNA pseudouridine synthase A n=1 Tax=[Bacillus] enclensis TaxID=1402860 RepID=A0A0V8H391_9BACI|nr:tRNA pseudouridine(38-40) synthase TruA [[Bacillus] enclensis]KSU56945.1 tRNA pseudouridine synthase A [[Bacillus] enclensis]SCC39144.1 tRNA pseudouridine38-40 synthase [[Bacillus] enclensis]
MKRVKCTISYDGTHFSGYQIQPNRRTVQGLLEDTLSAVHKGERVRVTASGRTDAGVHANGQVFHFDTPLSIPEEKWPVVLNTRLPDEVVIKEAQYTPEDFHARFSVKRKEYRYRVYTAQSRSPFLRHYALHHPFTLSVDDMKKAAEHLIGEHDFTSFCSAKTEVEDKVRNLQRITITEQEGEIIFSFTGNGFLYNMVRILVGTLLEAGSGSLRSEDMKDILEAKNRNQAGKTAPPHGLYLWKVEYGE